MPNETQSAAELQAVLEGVPLPASRRELLEYAARQEDGPRYRQQLERLPEREFRSLDDVGEELAAVQPEFPRPDAHGPLGESGSPPGGEAYTDAGAEPGAVRERGPRG